MLEFIDNLAAMARDDPGQLREAGAIAPLVSMLMSNQSDVSSRAAKVLRDLAETSSETKHEITQLQRVLGFTLKVTCTFLSAHMVLPTLRSTRPHSH